MKSILLYVLLLCLLTKKKGVFATDDCGIQIRLTKKIMDYGMLQFFLNWATGQKNLSYQVSVVILIFVTFYY